MVAKEKRLFVFILLFIGNIHYAYSFKMPSTYPTQFYLAMSGAPNISFFGRVVDQHNQPVIAAKIYTSGTNSYLMNSGGSRQLITDNEGYFLVDTSGVSLVLGGVSHPDIDRTIYGTRLLGAPSHGQVFDVYSSKTEEKINWKPYVKKSNPYVIHAWRLGKYEGAIKVRGKFTLYNGKTYTIDLSNFSFSGTPQEGKNKKGDFYITCNRSYMRTNRDYGDWSISIEPIEGGIQKADDLYMNIAPENGYKPSLNIVMHKGEKQYKNYSVNNRYYFYTNDGSTYGSILFSAKPFAATVEPLVTKDDGSCKITITGKLNPTSSRNLELKGGDITKQMPINYKMLANN